MGDALLTRPSLIARLGDPADRAAWRQFVELYGGLVYGFARRRVGVRRTSGDAAVRPARDNPVAVAGWHGGARYLCTPCTACTGLRGAGRDGRGAVTGRHAAARFPCIPCTNCTAASLDVVLSCTADARTELLCQEPLRINRTASRSRTATSGVPGTSLRTPPPYN